MFIGREEELKFLNNKFLGKKKEFGVIYGPRRIGKSSLIHEFIKNKPNIFFQAKKDSIYGNLESFSYEVNKLLSLPTSYVFNSFKEAFDQIIAYADKKRFIIAIDEYPYIVNQDSSFPSLLQEIVDKAPNSIFFLISGSDVSMLKDELLNHASPLYQRRTFEMNIKKLRYNEALHYMNNLNNQEKVKYLALTSTYPYYLSAMNFDLSFEENLQNLLIDEYGTFFNLPDQLLSNSSFSFDIYNAILYAISKRKRSNKDIALFIHEGEAKTNKYIATLVHAELVSKRETYMGNKKTVYYEINDPMLKFWYSFIFKNQELIRINKKLVYKNLINDIHQFLSFEFENVARLYMDYLNQQGKLGDVFPLFKPYKVDNSKLGRSIEIDGLSDNGKKMIVLECKYRKTLFSKAMYDHLVENTSIFSKKFDKEFYLFSLSGFTKELLNKKDKNVHLVNLDDLFNIRH